MYDPLLRANKSANIRRKCRLQVRIIAKQIHWKLSTKPRAFNSLLVYTGCNVLRMLSETRQPQTRF